MAGRWGMIVLALGVVAAASARAQERLLDPPVPLADPLPASPRSSSSSSEIRPVKAESTGEADLPAVRVKSIRTASGEPGTVSPRSIEPVEEYRRPPDADELFLKTKSKSEPPRGTSISDFDPPARKTSDRPTKRTRALYADDGLFFKGDDCFSNMISPVTNPHLFEDPRSLTELRPTFYYQKVPSGQPEWRGGNIWYFGTSARIAINERWSVTLNKLGAVDVDPGVAKNEFGFGEVHIGPKWTFWRDTDTETVAATGLIFQLPFGSSSVYQNTGTMSLVPYLSAGQQIADTKAGAINGLFTTGYSFSVNRDRSNFFYASGNVNFDWANRHRFYPLVEMNYFLYTTNGRERALVDFEARDVANLGSRGKGSNLLTTAFGARYKINERAQIGAAYEFPFLGNRDLFRYRFTVDVIIRF